MSSELLETIVGIVISVLGAGLAQSRLHTSFLAVLALGVALTALYVAVVPFPQDEPTYSDAGCACPIKQTTIVAHTPDPGLLSEDWDYPAFVAPSVPDYEASYELTALECDSPLMAAAAWTEVAASHPSADALYTVNAQVKNGRTYVDLRSRKGASGYAYVDVFALCSPEHLK